MDFRLEVHVMTARIYQPAKTAMQSGRLNTRRWVLEFEPERGKFVEPLMGWTGSANTQAQVRLKFPTEEAAVAYAEKHAIPYQVIRPQARTPKIHSYAENFR